MRFYRCSLGSTGARFDLPVLALCAWAALMRYYRDGALKAAGDSITEGIGQGRVTGNLEGFAPDTGLAFEVGDYASHSSAPLPYASLCAPLPKRGLSVAATMRSVLALGELTDLRTVCAKGRGRRRSALRLLSA